MVFSLRVLCCLLGYFTIVCLLGRVHGAPIDSPQNGRLMVRQATTTTQTTAATGTSVIPSTIRSTASVTTSSTVTSTTATTTRSTTSSQRTSTTSISSTSASTSSVSSTSSTTTSPSATTTSSSSSNIFSKSSKYFPYAIAVLVVVCVFGFLLLVLCIRFVVQKFSKKQPPSAAVNNPGQWQYAQDTQLYSTNATSNSFGNPAGMGARHKDVGSEMGEREAFLSTESVTLYPPAKHQERYTDDDSYRRHSRSVSSASQSTATPFSNYRPMSFLHSPPATHPDFIVDRGSESGHSHEEQALRSVPVATPEVHQPEAGPGPRSMPSLIAARATYSDPYRQHTHLSSAGVSRATSTASAYSQPSAIRTDTPPVPILPPAYAQPQRQVSSDVSAALSTMQYENPSTDTIYTNETGAAAPPVGSVHEQPSTLRQTPGRMGWGRQAPSSIHSPADLFFDHPHSR